MVLYIRVTENAGRGLFLRFSPQPFQDVCQTEQNARPQVKAKAMLLRFFEVSQYKSLGEAAAHRPYSLKLSWQSREPEIAHAVLDLLRHNPFKLLGSQ